MTTDPRGGHIVEHVVAAYRDGDVESYGDVLDPDVRFWSAATGWSQGEAAVRAQLEARFARLRGVEVEVARKAVARTTVVIELVHSGRASSGGRYHVGSTEVLEVRNGAIVLVKSYLDPDDLPST